MIKVLRYKGFAKCAVSAKLNLRGKILLSLLGALVEVSASFFLWKTLFQEQNQITGYSWNDMIFYLMIVFVINSTLGYGTESKISEKVLNGSVIMDLIKPLNFQMMCFAESVGSSIVEGIIAIMTGGIIAILIGDITEVITFQRAVLFILSFLLGYVIKYNISFFAGVCCFFTSNGYGVLYLRQVITDVFSGALLPITFYPIWFQNIASLLPFQSIIFFPSQIFLGRIQGLEVGRILGIQLVWAAITWLSAGLFFRLAIKKITIQGG